MNSILLNTLLEQRFREYKDETFQLFDLAEHTFDRQPRDALVSVSSRLGEIHVTTTRDCEWNTVFTSEQRLVLELAGYSVKYTRCSTSTREATELAAKRKYHGRGG